MSINNIYVMYVIMYINIRISTKYTQAKNYYIDRQASIYKYTFPKLSPRTLK